MLFGRHVDLPSELEGKVPKLVTELAVAIAGLCIAIVLRIAMEGLSANVIPFAMNFPVITAVVIVAGPRAGLMMLAGYQLLIWFVVLPRADSETVRALATPANLILVTGTQLLMLVIITYYRRAVRRLDLHHQRTIEGLSLALTEIDHRTKNNFQMAVSLLLIQARNTPDAAARAGLDRAAARLQTIASIYRNLAMSSQDLQMIRLHDHIQDLLGKLREGLLSPTIIVKLDSDPVIVPNDQAIRIGLIINELVTNAAKHAFSDGTGTISVSMHKDGDWLDLKIEDDGKGMSKDAPSDGLGTKLVTTMVRQLEGKMETRMDKGTIHHIHLPLKAA